MRIATFNVLHGRPLTDGSPASGTSQQPLADAVAALDVDVLALQEVDRYQGRSGDVDQAEIAATAMGATDWRYASALHGRAVVGVGWVRDHNIPGMRAYGPNDAADLAQIPSHGTALLTRRPVKSWYVRRFPGAPGMLPLRVVGRKGLTLVRDHARIAIAAVLDGPRGPFTVVATHLSFVPGWNLGQLAALYRWMADLPRPHVLLGDLNLVGSLPRAMLVGSELVDGLLVRRESPEHRWHDLAKHATYPAPRPIVQFDHVLAAGIPSSAVRVSSAPRTAISDHRPLIVELAE